MEACGSGIKEASSCFNYDHKAFEEQFLASLLLEALEDVSELLALDLTRDIAVVTARVKHEGFSFISRTMPKFYKHVLLSIENRNFTPTACFKRKILKGGIRAALPGFLQGLLAYLFKDNGVFIYPTTDKMKAEQAEVLKIVEQLCLGFGYKYEFEGSDELFNKQIQAAIDLEKDLMTPTGLSLAADDSPDVNVISSERRRDYKLYDHPSNKKITTHWAKVQRRATQLCHCIMHNFDPRDITPRHGPGAVFETVDRPHEKYNFDYLPHDLGALYPYHEYFTSSACSSYGDPQSIRGTYKCHVRRGGKRLSRRKGLGSEHYLDTFMPSLKNAIALSVGGMNRASMVPKNSEKMRQINIESKELMWIQKGLQQALYEWIESSPFLRVPTPFKELLSSPVGERRSLSCINFTDQSINGRLAKLASATREYATLDMKSASTYVTTAHVNRLVPAKIAAYLNAARSKVTLYKKKCKVWQRDLATHKVAVVESETFAPMGSAVCFPVESLVFYCYAKAILELEGSGSPVFVYGDDTLVPTRHAEKVVEGFEHFGFRVNREKSFIHGLFRESCGVNAYSGVVCSAPCRAKKRMYNRLRTRWGHPVPSRFSESEMATSFVAWLEYSNVLYRENFPRVAAAIRSQLKWSYPKEYDHLVRVRKILGTESYLCLLDYTSKQPHSRTRERSLSDLKRLGAELDHLESQGVTLGSNRTIYQYLSIAMPENYQQRYLRGVSLKNTEYTLLEDDPEFPDHLAYLRWLVEHSESSRTFGLRNQCRLQVGWHTLQTTTPSVAPARQ